MLKERLINGRKQNGVSDTTVDSEPPKSIILSEWKAATLALFIALFVLTSKTVLSNREAIRNALWETKFTYLETLLPDGGTVGYHINEISLKTSYLWMPLASGIFITFFTWGMIYYDSDMPGVVPPSPFSPNKSRSKTKAVDLGYLMGIVNGVMVFIYMAVSSFYN